MSEMEKETDIQQEFAIYDPVDRLVTIILSERVAYTLTLDEFSDFHANMVSTFDQLSEEEDLVVGESFDPDTRSTKKVLMVKPEEGDLN